MFLSEIESILPLSILNSTTYSVTVTDFHGNYIYVNKTYKNRFSFFDDDLVGKNCKITMHHDDYEKVLLAISKCINNPNKYVKIYTRMPKNDYGYYIWTNWECSILNGLDGKPFGILFIGHDVTLEKIMQKQLRESENKLSALLDSTNHSNIFISPDLTVIYFNRVAYETVRLIFGKSMKVGDFFLQYVLAEHHELFFNHFFSALNGELIRWEWEMNLGEVAYFEATFYPVFNDHGEIFGVSFNSEDITHKKLAELKILEQNQRLLEIAWSQSHQIRGPLSSIMSIVSLVNSHLDIESKLEVMQHLDSATQKLDEVIREIVEKTNLEKK